MVVSSPSTVRAASGPARKSWLDPFTMSVKSASAGEYAAAPPHCPMIAEICGTRPEAITFRKKMSA